MAVDKVVGVTWSQRLGETFTLCPVFSVKFQNEVVFGVEEL